jgi:hypothetical protein
MRKYTDHFVVPPCCLRCSLSWFLFLSSFFLFLLSPRLESSVWLKLVPSICVGIVSCVVTMDPSHGREIHYHLTRAIMDLNTIAGFLPFFEPTVDWHEHPHDPYGGPLRVHPSHRHLHTFVPPSRFFLHSYSRIPWRATHPHDSESGTSLTPSFRTS